MARLLTSFVGTLAVGGLLFAGCSGSTFDGSGSSGGAASGGAASGGAASGGTASGGNASAGKPNGGSDSKAGAGSGGSSSGGDAGGAPSGACKADTDCLQCVFNQAPTKTEECYCTNCAWKPLTQQQCATNRAAFEKYCSKAAIPCPAIACIEPPEAHCVGGMCVSGSAP